MPFVRLRNGTALHLLILPHYRLRLDDGGYVYMEFAYFGGPRFYRDRNLTREIEDWWEDPRLVKACEWFCARGHKA